MAEKSFPLENTKYTAEDAQLWFATRTSGVYAGEHLPVSTSGNMEVTLGAGIAWLNYGTFAGIVYGNTENKTLTVEMSDAQHDRIDRVCIRLEILNNRCFAYVKKGNPAVRPVEPVLQRDNVAYEISVAKIYVGAGVTDISAGNITDERMDATVCGLMRDGVTGIDTSMLTVQASNLIEELKNNLQAVYNNVELANVTHIRGMLYLDGWSAGEPPTQTVEAKGILGADHAKVDVDMTDATTVEEMIALDAAWSSNILKATANANTVTVYFRSVPKNDIPIKIEVVR